MLDLLYRLADPSGFMPRGQCGRWTPFFRALAITNDAMYSIAYLGIPIAALVFWSIRREALGRYRWLYPLGASFVFGCGVTHICNVAVWWRPSYPLFTVLGVPGAVASVAFLAAVPFAIREWLDTPTAEEWRAVNADLASKLGQLQAAHGLLRKDRDKLAREVERLMHRRETEDWSETQERKLSDLMALLEGVDRCSNPP